MEMGYTGCRYGQMSYIHSEILGTFDYTQLRGRGVLYITSPLLAACHSRGQNHQLDILLGNFPYIGG